MVESKPTVLLDPSFFSKTKLLAVGGQARVFLCRDNRTQELVALKEIPFVNPQEEDLKQVKLEIESMDKLKHPHIINIRGYF